MTSINSVGYVVTDKENNVIYGHGASVVEAWAEVVDGVRGDFAGIGGARDGGALCRVAVGKEFHRVQP